MKLVIDCLIYEFKKAPGYEQYLHNTLDYFYENNLDLIFDEVVLAVRKTQLRSFEKYSTKFTIKGFNIKNIIGQLFVQNVLKQKLKLNKDDVILFTCGYASILKQCKSVVVVFDLLHLHYPEYFIIARRIQRAILVPAALRISDKVIAISSFTRNDILENFTINPIKVDYIYINCNFTKFALISNDGSETVKELQKFEKFISNKEKYFLSVLSSGPNKNLILLIKAFIEVAKYNNEYYLILVGNSTKMDSLLIELIMNAGIEDRIIYSDYICNYTLGLLYSHCSAFILPTKFEGFGMPIVEALYFNVPVIVTDIEICHEIAGDFAQYIDCDNEKFLAEAMFNIILGNIEIRDTKSMVCEKYSFKNTSGKYIELLNKIAME